ncbi:hypothetical protein F8M41_017070 [Gigaspora margarita]|uniref:Uncharacterized protein n=1 Tax=Gigaspora margarita TaxID=4874 RepID=A0A8H4ANP9_GIGMA|nr:hypothetical protein F8M41_017070 [Gigaspora margarita]
MSLQNHSFFSNIFEKTHEELVSLNSTFNQLSIVYKPQENLEIDSYNSNELENNLLLINNSELMDDSLLIDNSQEEEAYLSQLSTNEYCTSICLAKVNYNNGLIKYKQIQNYTKAELDIFLLAMMEAPIKTPEQTTKGVLKHFILLCTKLRKLKFVEKHFL